MPFFSIIIPCYNRAPQIIHTLKSLLEQTYQDFEIVVVDDGSTDNTKNVLKSYIEKSQLKYIYQENQGVSVARNKGSTHANGKYLIFLDSDDKVEKNWLKDFYDVIISEKSSIVYCSMKKVDKNGNIILVNSKKPYKNSNSKGIINTGSWAIEQSKFFEAGMYDEQLKFGENTELRIRLDKMNLSIGFVDNFNFIYNLSDSVGSQNNQNKLDSILYTLDKHSLYFNKNPRLKKLQLQTAAVAAIKLGMYQKGNQIFKKALLENKTNLKLWLQYLISSNTFFIKLIWK